MWLKAIGAGLLIGALLALWPAYAAFDHNPQHEFVDVEGRFTSDLYLLYIIATGFFSLPAVLLFLIIGVLRRSAD